MISRIRLVRYGLFQDRSFDFAPVTIFLGPNESGKSTLFDALFDSTTVAPGTHGKVKRNVARYGKGREVVVEGTIPPPEISPEEFLSVLAVDSGDLTVPEGRGPWIDRLKAQLFTDGVDPLEIAQELAKEASEKKSAGHIKEYLRLQKQEEEIRSSLEEALARRREMVQRRKEADDAAKTRGRKERELATVAEERRSKKALLQSGEQQLRRRQIRQALSEAADLLGVEGELERDSYPGDADAEELRNLLHRREEAEADLREAEQILRTTEMRLSEVRSSLAEVERRGARLRQQVPLAQSLREILDRGFGTGSLRRRLIFLSLALLAGFGTAATAVFLMSPPESFLAGAGGALVTGLLLIAGLIRRGPSLGEIRDRWLAATGDSLSAESPEGLRRELSGVESVLDHVERELQEHQERLTSLGREADGLRDSYYRRENDLRQIATALEQWASRFSVKTPEEGLRKASRGRELGQRRSLLYDHLEPWKDEFGVEDLGALREELRLQAGALEEAVASTGRLEATDLKALRREVEALEENEEELRREIQQLETEEAAKRATYSELFAGLPEQILAGQRALTSTQGELRRLDRRRRGAGIASEIFARLAEDSTLALGDLAGELGATYRKITGSDAGVLIDRIDPREASAVDAGGTSRGLADLSQGTQDVLMWSFRIEMARKARPEPAILVLDDPFLAVDPERRSNCLSVLKERLVDHGWQVILLTKDEPLAMEARNLHPESVVHTLKRR